MKFQLMILSATLLAVPCEAREHLFEGSRVGVDSGYEDYGEGLDGETLAAVVGWDIPLHDKFVLGAEGRYNLRAVERSITTTTPAGFLQTADITIDDNWGLAGRLGYAATDKVLFFAQGGYESLEVEAFRTVRAPVCAPPDGCTISRTDFSMGNDMWTIGAGVEWAATKNLRLRGQYTYGESQTYDRSRLSLLVAMQF